MQKETSLVWPTLHISWAPCYFPGTSKLFSFLLQYSPGIEVRLTGHRTKFRKSQASTRNTLAFGLSPCSQGAWAAALQRGAQLLEVGGKAQMWTALLVAGDEPEACSTGCQVLRSTCEVPVIPQEHQQLCGSRAVGSIQSCTANDEILQALGTRRAAVGPNQSPEWVQQRVLHGLHCWVGLWPGANAEASTVMRQRPWENKNVMDNLLRWVPIRTSPQQSGEADCVSHPVLRPFGTPQTVPSPTGWGMHSASKWPKFQRQSFWVKLNNSKYLNKIISYHHLFFFFFQNVYIYFFLQKPA